MKRLTTEKVAMKLPNLKKVWEFTASHWENVFKNEVKAMGTIDRWTPVNERVVISKEMCIFELEENDNYELPAEVVLNIDNNGTSDTGQLREAKGRTKGKSKGKGKS